MHNYSRRLAQQKVDDQKFSRSGPAYAPLVTDKDEHYTLTQPSYPYADAPHSFSNTTDRPHDSGYAAGYYNDNQSHV